MEDLGFCTADAVAAQDLSDGEPTPKGGGQYLAFFPKNCMKTNNTFFYFHVFLGKNLTKQECIPVGCVPAAAVATTRCQ